MMALSVMTLNITMISIAKKRSLTIVVITQIVAVAQW
jgi:hypothetical protein